MIDVAWLVKGGRQSSAGGRTQLHVNRPPARKNQRKWDTLLCLLLCHCCALLCLLCLFVPCCAFVVPLLCLHRPRANFFCTTRAHKKYGESLLSYRPLTKKILTGANKVDSPLFSAFASGEIYL